MDYIELRHLMEEQKEEMTPSERMKAYMAGEEVDVLPYVIKREVVACQLYLEKTQEIFGRLFW